MHQWRSHDGLGQNHPGDFGQHARGSAGWRGEDQRENAVSTMVRWLRGGAGGGASAGGLGWSVDPGSEQLSGAEGRPDQGLGAGSGGGGSRSRSRHGLTTMGEMSLVPLNSIAASDPGPQRLQHWAWMPTPPSSVPGLQSWGVPSPYWALSMERVPREAPSRQSGLLSLWRALHPQHVLPPCGPRCQPSHPGPGAGSYT